MPQVTVEQLVPGDRIQLEGAPMKVVYVGQGPHPMYGGLRAVIWHFPDGHFLDREMKFSVDALDPRQEVGVVVDINRNPSDRINDLFTALNGAPNNRIKD